MTKPAYIKITDSGPMDGSRKAQMNIIDAATETVIASGTFHEAWDEAVSKGYQPMGFDQARLRAAQNVTYID